ncbi:MAG: DUF1501 domain-containing protein [Thermodesulfobacteriota bacterium]
MNRRRFLASLALCAATAAVPGAALAAKRAAGQAKDPQNAPLVPRKRLVVVFLRGGVDALSVLPPVSDPFYALARPSTALSGPGQPGGAVDLGEGVFLHPALAPLAGWYRDGRLAFVQGLGTPALIRDHDAARRVMEAGAPNPSAASDGWLNRLALELGRPASPEAKKPDRAVRAVAVSPKSPLILAGKARIAVLPPGRFVYPAGEAALPELAALDKAVAPLYAAKGVPQPLSRSFREGAAWRRDRLAAYEREMVRSRNGDPPVSRFPDLAGRLVAEFRRLPEAALGFLAFGGFDTHVAQGAATGRLAEALAHAAGGLAALAEALGPALAETVVVVVSEFGRGLLENAVGGTDNGHGGLMWLFGGSVAGGRVHGEEPSLAGRRLYRERLLPVTMDFREPLAAAATAHLGLSGEAVARVFPGFEPTARPETFFGPPDAASRP